MPDTPADAQAEKRALDQKRKLKEGRRHMVRLMAFILEQELDLPPKLDRDVCAWLMDGVEGR